MARKSLKWIYIRKEDGKICTSHELTMETYDYVRCGPCSNTTNVEFCADTLSNWIRGMTKRVAHETTHDPVERSKLYRFFSEIILPTLPVLPAGLIDDVLRDIWLDDSHNYTQKRKELLRFLAALYYSHQIRPESIYIMSSFIKKEYYDKLKEPRIINSRTDTFKTLVGPYIHQVEKLVMSNGHFIKHMHPEEVAMKMNEIAQSHYCVYETDYSSFEGSFDLDFMQHIEWLMFQHVLVNYPQILDIIRPCYFGKNVCTYKKKWKCSFEGSRMSGDMWTSLCNGFSNYVMVSYYIYCARQEHGYFNADFIVEGDDGFIGTDYPLPFEKAKLLGFDLKCEQKFDKNDVSFCGICEYHGKLIPDIPRILNKYGYSFDRDVIQSYIHPTKSNMKKRKDLIHSKALSLLAQSQGIPILQAVAQQQLRLGGRFNPKYVDWWELNFYDFSHLDQMKAVPIRPDIRRFVAKRFNIPISVQLEIEEQLKHCDLECYDIDLNPRVRDNCDYTFE